MNRHLHDIGLLWEDHPAPRRGHGPRQRGPMPEIPYTGWRPPAEFPNLSAAKVIGFDTETWDPELLKAGPGWSRDSGHIIGVSLSVSDGSSWYFPIRHGWEKGKQVLPDNEATYNMDPEQVMRYLAHTLGGRQPKVGANLIYDVGWLMEEGVNVGGFLYDIQFAEALLNSEAPDVSLDSLGEKYLGRGKETNILYEWLAHWCGGAISDRQRANLFLSPPSLAGPYAEADASMPIRILEQQWPLLIKRGVLDLFHLECRLIPLLVKMRRKGAPVDVDKAEELHDRLANELGAIEARLKDIAGQPVNPAARDSIKSAFVKLGIDIPTAVDLKTGQSKVSFAAPVLEAIDHPLVETILDYRRIEKVRGTFVKGYILDKNVDGVLHCSFHPLKGAGRGARSGRFASSDPNLQNIPIRTKIGKLVRECFAATHGGRWRKLDYSQIEYRMLAHHAVGPGSDDLRQAYNQNPDIDFHDHTTDLILKMTGLETNRRQTKNINFGLTYGMAKPKLIRSLGLSTDKGIQLYNAYHKAAPYSRATMDACSKEIDDYGYVETILGRKSDFPFWGFKGFGEDRRGYSYDEAVALFGHGNIERAFRHKGLNRKLQGGAADVMKAAMVAAYEAGLFEDDACGMPCLTVHDELDFDDQGSPDSPAWDELKRVMETSTPQISVPIRIDMSIGKTWGSAD